MSIFRNPANAGLSVVALCAVAGFASAASAQGTPIFGAVSPTPVTTEYIEYGAPIESTPYYGSQNLTNIRNVESRSAELSNVELYCGDGFSLSASGTTCVADAPVVENYVAPEPYVAQESYIPPEPVIRQAPPPPPPSPPVVLNPPPLPPAPPQVAPVPVNLGTGLSGSALAAGAVGAAALVGIIALIASDDDDNNTASSTTGPN